MRRALLLLLLAACNSDPKPAPPPAPKPAPAPAPAPVPPPEPAPPPPPPRPLAQRPGGPSLEDCARAADHLGAIVVNALPGSSAEERAYAKKLTASGREGVMRYCLEIAVPKEIACVSAAKTTEGLVGCENFRRELTEELVAHTEATEADCARFFDRLRQFKLAEGATPDEVDKTRDQIIRTCQERAKPGTIACFIASPTYEQARRCP